MRHLPRDRGVSTVALVTLCSSPRRHHLANQLAMTADEVRRIVVWVGEDDPPPVDAEQVIRVPPGAHGLRLAAARNAGAAAAIAAGASLIVFLDADCVPGPDLFERYRAASEAKGDAVLCGPVTYLAPGVDATDAGALVDATAPHPARPNPDAGATREASGEEYPLFWSLSFAVTAQAWSRLAGFDEGYEGYGGEDTDFAFALRRDGCPLVWVGGAHAYHQHHATSSPPWQHLDDILRNGRRFADRWGEWPMTGWLAAFADAGAIAWDGGTWVSTGEGRSRSARTPR